ncbi:multicopper oxidase family protein [Legionella sp.]|uniref:multicopper oxidase family protein n=1 Tax=Legionella sp. TaxID=459 RepID=UPI000CC009E0|nr:multicopper oxidase family protein [Legionella sp.]PJE16632.1 MAG: copper oxidase [Legionella sp.]
MTSILRLIVLTIVIATPYVLHANPITLNVISEPITVNGRESTVFNIIQPDGKAGFTGIKGQDFNVLVVNKTKVPLVIHWHGLIDPNPQDGVPYVTQLPIPAGGKQQYHFKLVQAGTFWMHSHEELQIQNLMAAPLIIQDPAERMIADQEVVVMLQDFSFRSPEQIYEELRHKNPMTNMSMGKMPMKMDLNDVKFDAYLANRRTLQNPQIIPIKSGSTIRLRLINASSSTNYWVYTGTLASQLVAMDGAKVKPFAAKQFELGLANRIDLLIKIPEGEGAYPILAQPEGTNSQTGVILATPSAKIPQLSDKANTTAPALNNSQEHQLKAVNPLAQKTVDKVLTYRLEGGMKNYVWKINNEVWPKVTPFLIDKGQRVELEYINNTEMAHPMHFHGHVFEVTEINGKPITDGPYHDTVLILPNSTMKLQFDADNPGIWFMHCHIIYHAKGGMDTTINYRNYPEPDFYKKLISTGIMSGS